MDSLTRLAQEQNVWYLEEFTERANELLSEYVSTDQADQKDINPRLVRYYTTERLLDEPERQGKYAVYTYRHLLQLLVVRRLLSEGIGKSAIGKITLEKTNQELENFLKGDVKLEVNPALAFLESLEHRENIKSSAPESTWVHLEVLSGLEILMRSDFKYPDTPYQEKILQQQILQTLKEFIAKQREGKR